MPHYTFTCVCGFSDTYRRKYKRRDDAPVCQCGKVMQRAGVESGIAIRGTVPRGPIVGRDVERQREQRAGANPLELRNCGFSGFAAAVANQPGAAIGPIGPAIQVSEPPPLASEAPGKPHRHTVIMENCVGEYCYGVYNVHDTHFIGRNNTLRNVVTLGEATDSDIELTGTKIKKSK